jgi:hypothetical protein
MQVEDEEELEAALSVHNWKLNEVVALKHKTDRMF